MRVVVLEKDQSSAAYMIIKTLGWVAAALALVVCVLMIGNKLSLDSSDPVHSVALAELIEQLNDDPRNELLKTQIQEMDLLARKAFFASQEFNQRGIYILLGSLVIMLASFKIIASHEAKHPFPDSSDPKDDPREQARWARKSVSVAGLILAGLALSLALPWDSPLDHPLPSDLAGVDGPPGPEAGAEGSGESVPKSLPIASAEQMRDHWPVFLGTSAPWVNEIELPESWNGETGEGIKWKVKLELPGFNSPIIWGDKIFLTGANAERREVFCFSIEDGQLLWNTEIPPSKESGETPEVSDDTGYAAPTLACNGAMLYAVFANGDLCALNLEGGLEWKVHMGNPVNPYGYSSSPQIHKDMVLIQMDREEHSFVAAYDAASGKQRWKTDRTTAASWSSPLLIEWEQKTAMVVVTDPNLSLYDADTGSFMWEIECLSGGEIASVPVFSDGRLYVSADYVHVAAVDIASQSIAWENTASVPGISTPIVYNGLYFGGLGDGALACLDAETGEELWYETTDDGFYSSPVQIGEKIYLFDRGGSAHVFETTGEAFKGNSDSQMGEPVLSTPALFKQGMIVRGEQHLYCIQK